MVWKIKMGAYPTPKQIILQFKSDFPDPQRQLLLTVNIISTHYTGSNEYWPYSVIYHSNIMKWVFSSPSYKHRDRTWEVKELALGCETTDKCWSHAS